MFGIESFRIQQICTIKLNVFVKEIEKKEEEKEKKKIQANVCAVYGMDVGVYT